MFSVVGQNRRPLSNPNRLSLVSRGQTGIRGNTKSVLIEPPNDIGTRGSRPTSTTTSRPPHIVPSSRAFGAARGVVQHIATSQVTSVSLFGESSEATSPRSLDTAPSFIHNSIGECSSSYGEHGMKFEHRRETRLDDAESERWQEFPYGSTPDYDEDLIHVGLWSLSSSCSDASTSPWTRHTEPAEQSERTGGSSLARGSQGPVPLIRMPDAPNTYSNLHSSTSHKSDSETHEYITCSQCALVFRGKYSKGNLARHQRLKHQGTTKTYPCNACDRVFYRQDARLKHMRKHHKNSMSAPLDPGSSSAASSKHDHGTRIPSVPESESAGSIATG